MMARCNRCWDDKTVWARQGDKSVEIPCPSCAGTTTSATQPQLKFGPASAQPVDTDPIPFDQLKPGDRFWVGYEVAELPYGVAVSVISIGDCGSRPLVGKDWYDSRARRAPESNPVLQAARQVKDQAPGPEHCDLDGEVMWWNEECGCWWCDPPNKVINRGPETWWIPVCPPPKS